MSKDSLTNFLESMDISTGDLRTLFRRGMTDASRETNYQWFESGDRRFDRWRYRWKMGAWSCVVDHSVLCIRETDPSFYTLE